MGGDLKLRAFCVLFQQLLLNSCHRNNWDITFFDNHVYIYINTNACSLNLSSNLNQKSKPRIFLSSSKKSQILHFLNINVTVICRSQWLSSAEGKSLKMCDNNVPIKICVFFNFDYLEVGSSSWQPPNWYAPVHR